ncbi:VOC family protein [Bacillus daqingensis]|uniref:VOC family protein n=1 Tax=Bacillus daqingensis TaxID=872396 RepID=A0ABV9NVC8_9BACI
MDHLELYVSRLDESEAYWGWLLQELGFTPFQHWEEGRSWRHGDFYLVIVQTEERFQDVPYHRCRTGLNHLAFRVPTKADVDRLTQEVKKRGMPILYEDRHPFAGGPDHYALYTEDPDRMKVEITAEEA